MDKKIIGYIVTISGCPCVLHRYAKTDPLVLTLHSQPPKATLFTGRNQAKRAINRTRFYAKHHNLNWSLDHEIVTLLAPDKSA